uniref:Uncharacterized protein n=1 Tax=Percolomonas cosmopolitus TaxID=63605 RepID=A0A7S1PI00_9EUKA
MLWCCEFSSAAINSAEFLQKHSREIRKTLKDNKKLQSKDYKWTSCENRWDKAVWTIPFPQLYDWIWKEGRKEFTLQDGSIADVFEFPLTAVAQRLDAAIQRMHGVSAMEDVEEEGQ